MNLLFSKHPLDISKKVSILKDVSAGMIHLEKENIIHRLKNKKELFVYFFDRDLAARNVLLSEGFLAKVSDFGLSRMSENDSGVSTVATFGYVTFPEPY